MAKNKLSDTLIKGLKPRSKTYKVFDGGGLYIEVLPSGGKSWRLKYLYNGEDKRRSLGLYPYVSLAEARRKLMKPKRFWLKVLIRLWPTNRKLKTALPAFQKNGMRPKSQAGRPAIKKESGADLKVTFFRPWALAQ